MKPDQFDKYRQGWLSISAVASELSNLTRLIADGHPWDARAQDLYDQLKKGMADQRRMLKDYTGDRRASL